MFRLDLPNRQSRRDVKKRNRGRPQRFMDVVKDWRWRRVLGVICFEKQLKTPFKLVCFFSNMIVKHFVIFIYMNKILFYLCFCFLFYSFAIKVQRFFLVLPDIPWWFL